MTYTLLNNFVYAATSRSNVPFRNMYLVIKRKIIRVTLCTVNIISNLVDG